MQPERVAVFRKVKDAVTTAALWLLIGWFSAAYYYRPVAPAPLPPAPPPAPPAPVARPVKHAGHFTLSYIEPKYPRPASAAVRGQLAAANWASLDATFRSYTDGQSQLTTLGFDRCFQSADLPIAFLQEDGPGGAPIIGSIRSPASGDAVVAWVKGMRGQ